MGGNEVLTIEKLAVMKYWAQDVSLILDGFTLC
jgi:hypothetical protein